MSSTNDEHPRSSPVEDAIRKLEIASRLRELARHPAAVALAVQRVTTAINWLIWTGILFGIAFSTANVQQFAAAGAPAFTLQWWAAWLFEPFINLVLIAILLGQQVCARYHITMDAKWPTATKWVCFTATFAMNTWTYWSPFDLAGVVLHAIPPGIVLCAAETAPALNDALARAADAAEQAAQEQAAHAAHAVITRSDTDAPAASGATGDTANDTVVNLGAPLVPAESAKRNTASHPATNANRAATPHAPVSAAESHRKGQQTPAQLMGGATRAVRRRRTRQEIIDEVVRQWRPGITVDRQWVLRVSECSAGIATDVAEAVRVTLLRQSHEPDDGTDRPAEPTDNLAEPTYSTTEHTAHQPAPARP